MGKTLLVLLGILVAAWAAAVVARVGGHRFIVLTLVVVLAAMATVIVAGVEAPQ